MAHLIDKDAVIAEIERRMQCYDRNGCEPNGGKWVELISIKHFIDTLEVKEVDLEGKILGNAKTDMGKTSLEHKVKFWSECKGTKQPTIRKCNGCPMFTVHNEKPTCLYDK